MWDASKEDIKRWYEAEAIDLNGIVYTKTKTTNKISLRVMGCMQKFALPSAAIGDDNWYALEKDLFNVFTIDNVMLSRLPDHFEVRQEDYLPFMFAAMAVVTYPFTKGSPIG